MKLLLTILLLLGATSISAQTSAKPSLDSVKIAEYREKLSLDYSMPDYSVKKIDESKIGSHLANILRYFEENGTRGTLTSWISSILAEQNETFKNRYIELKKLKLQKVLKKGDEITIIYNASLQAPAGLPSQADLMFHFLDGVSESKPVNEMFSYISRYVTAREQLSNDKIL